MVLNMTQTDVVDDGAHDVLLVHRWMQCESRDNAVVWILLVSMSEWDVRPRASDGADQGLEGEGLGMEVLERRGRGQIHERLLALDDPVACSCTAEMHILCWW